MNLTIDIKNLSFDAQSSKGEICINFAIEDTNKAQIVSDKVVETLIDVLNGVNKNNLKPPPPPPPPRIEYTKEQLEGMLIKQV